MQRGELEGVAILPPSPTSVIQPEYFVLRPSDISQNATNASGLHLMPTEVRFVERLMEEPDLTKRRRGEAEIERIG